MTKTDMTNMLNSFENNSRIEHSRKVAAATKKCYEEVEDNPEGRATALITLTNAEKIYLTTFAKDYAGLSLSAFLRIAAKEFIKNHE